MNDLNRIKSIIEKLMENIPQNGPVQLAVGELHNTNEELIRRQWNELTTNTPLAKIELRIRIVRAEQQCMTCFSKYHPTQNETVCPYCGGMGAKVLSGEEFHLESQ